MRWAETDLQGIVFNGHYLTYFDVAITEYWRAIGKPYPASFEATYPETARDKLAVALRIILVIPHAIVLFFLSIAFVIVTVIAWFAILFTGAYPEELYTFAVGCLRWSLRVESYLLLMRDEYPPFSFEP